MPQLHATGFSTIPYALLDELGDRKNIGWLYLWLHRHGHGSANGAWASIATLARECHMDAKAVKAALRWLLERGWIERRQRPGQSSAYFLRLDPPAASASPARRPGHEPDAPQVSNAPRVSNTTQGANTPQHLGGKCPPPPGGHLTPTNKNPGTRAQEQEPPSVFSLPAPSLSAAAAGVPHSEAEHRNNSDDVPSCEQPTPLERQVIDQATAPDDSELAVVLANPHFPWGGTYGNRPPDQRPALAPRLPLPVEQLPSGLQPIADRLESYWLAKGGSRSSAAFAALLEELQIVLPVSGRSGVSELLRQACQAGWPAINGRSWLAQQGRDHSSHQQQAREHQGRQSDLSAHPAYRPFLAA